MDEDLEEEVREFMRPFDELLQEWIKTAGMQGAKDLSWLREKGEGETVETRQ